MDKQKGNVKNIFKKQNGIRIIGQDRQIIIIMMPSLFSAVMFHS
jgi:hypothetical protein